MLYERWCEVVTAHAGEVALRDLASGRSWTFGELRAAGESWSLPATAIVHPRGNGPEFVFTVLAAWRAGRVVCPLETGQMPPHVPVPPQPCIHLKLTSATAGAARCIVFSATQLATDAENIVATMGLRPDWPNLGFISLAHSYGFSNLVLPLLLHGIPLALGGTPLPEIVKRSADNESAVTLAAVPALWRAWHEAGAISPNVRLAISAGAPLPVALEQNVFRDTGLKIHNFYGSSECGGIAYDACNAVREDDEFAGTAMENVSLTVASNGCLVVHSAAVGEGYWPESDACLGAGRFQTSDLAELREGGVLLRGRIGDQINVAGRKLNPSVVERALQEHPAINTCLVFGVPAEDSARGETVVVCYQAAASISVGELRRFLLDRLPSWQLPRDWCPVEALPANKRGKLSRAEWRKWFLQHRESATRLAED